MKRVYFTYGPNQEFREPISITQNLRGWHWHTTSRHGRTHHQTWDAALAAAKRVYRNLVVEDVSDIVACKSIPISKPFDISVTGKHDEVIAVVNEDGRKVAENISSYRLAQLMAASITMRDTLVEMKIRLSGLVGLNPCLMADIEIIDATLAKIDNH